MIARPLAKLRGIKHFAWILWIFAGVALFIMLAWEAQGPGKIWAFNRLAHAGSGMLLDAGRETIFRRIAIRSGGLAILWGILLFLAFLGQWIRARTLPRRLGIGVLFFSGANLCTQFIKSALPHVFGVLGLPLNMADGFPSGHTTMAVSFALTILMLAPPRWRPWMTPTVALGAVLVSCSLFFAGYHPPIDILGAVLLTLGLALLTMRCLPEADPDDNSGCFQRALALIVGSLGLVWLLSGLLGAFLALDATLPGRTAALAAYSAGWRLVAGSVLLAVGLGAMKLAGPFRRVGTSRPFLVVSLLLLLLSLTDVLLQQVQLRARERSPKVALEAELLRQVWLNRAGQNISTTGDSMRWVIGGYIPKWANLAILSFRIGAVDEDLKDFGTKPMDDVEREAYVRLTENWSTFRIALRVAAAQVQAGPLSDKKARKEASEHLHRLQARTEASLSELLQRVKNRS